GSRRPAVQTAYPEVDGAARSTGQGPRGAQGPGEDQDHPAREAEVRAGTKMSVKAQVTGTVISDKMQKTVVVAVERKVRHEVYGKTQRKTSTFVAHNENNEAKIGDTVAIVESRPLSRRKRWVLTRVVTKAP